MAPSSSPSPSKKLLIADPKPKSDPICASSSSTTSTTPPPEKRTRDQPNLSDCHGCGRRINYTNPKDRLQPLDSVWRIVLLCRNCRKSVHSGRTCSYCYQGTGTSGDLYTCQVCERKIHKNCVRDYGNCTPWCYVGVGLERFRVCIDCWVPEMLKNSIGVSGRSDNKGGSKDKGAAKDVSENVVQEAKCGVEKKIKRLKAKGNVLRQVHGEMSPVDLATGESDLVAKKDVDSLKSGNSNCSCAFEVEDDAELAIHLHRVINSSPRISNKSLVNSDSLDSIRNWEGLCYKRSGLRKKCSEDQKLRTFTSCAENEKIDQPTKNFSSIVFSRLHQGLVPYKRDQKRKIWQLDIENNVVSESTSSQQAELKNLHSDDAGIRCSMKSGADKSGDSVCISTDQRNGDRFGQDVVSYKRTRLKKKVGQVSGMLAVSRDSSHCDGHIVALKPDFCQPDDVNISTGFPVKGDSKSKVILPRGICEMKQDRYHLKYVKRDSKFPGTKRDSKFPCYGTFLVLNQVAAPAVSNSEAGYSMNRGELILPNGTCTFNQETDRYSFKYSKRAKRSKSGSNSETELHSDDFLNKLGISVTATALTMNCSAESRTLSDVSFDSLTVDLPK